MIVFSIIKKVNTGAMAVLLVNVDDYTVRVEGFKVCRSKICDPGFCVNVCICCTLFSNVWSRSTFESIQSSRFTNTVHGVTFIIYDPIIALFKI